MTMFIPPNHLNKYSRVGNCSVGKNYCAGKSFISGSPLWLRQVKFSLLEQERRIKFCSTLRQAGEKVRSTKSLFNERNIEDFNVYSDREKRIIQWSFYGTTVFFVYFLGLRFSSHSMWVKFQIFLQAFVWIVVFKMRERYNTFCAPLFIYFLRREFGISRLDWYIVPIILVLSIVMRCSEKFSQILYVLSDSRVFEDIEWLVLTILDGIYSPLTTLFKTVVTKGLPLLVPMLFIVPTIRYLFWPVFRHLFPYGLSYNPFFFVEGFQILLKDLRFSLLLKGRDETLKILKNWISNPEFHKIVGEFLRFCFVYWVASFVARVGLNFKKGGRSDIQFKEELA